MMNIRNTYKYNLYAQNSHHFGTKVLAETVKPETIGLPPWRIYNHAGSENITQLFWNVLKHTHIVCFWEGRNRNLGREARTKSNVLNITSRGLGRGLVDPLPRFFEISNFKPCILVCI